MGTSAIAIYIIVIFRAFLPLVNGSKNSIFNWVSNLNLDHQTFLHFAKMLPLNNLKYILFSEEWPSGLLRQWHRNERYLAQIPKYVWSGLGTQPHHMAASKLWFEKIDKHNDYHWVREAVPWRMSQSWLWGMPIADKKYLFFEKYQKILVRIFPIQYV